MTVFGFDEQSAKKIAHAVARLKVEQQNIHKKVRNLTARADENAVQVRTGITATTPDEPVYPSDGCLVPFYITDAEFDPSPTGAPCTPTDKRQWGTYHTGRSSDGSYILEGTEILFVEIPTPDGHKFWIWPFGNAGGAIAFTMTTDRTREDAGGLHFGKAQADIDDALGAVPDAIGENVEINFVDKRWLEAVTGCQGWALYIDGVYEVVECQGMPSIVICYTRADRTAGAPQEDIECDPITSWGKAQDDLPIEDVFPPIPGAFDCGFVEWTWTGPPTYEWQVTDLSNVAECCVFSNTTPPPPPVDPEIPDQTTTTTDNFTPGPTCEPPSGSTGFKVRFYAGTWPRMVKGALVIAVLDNNIRETNGSQDILYWAELSDQLTTRIRFSAEEDICGTATTTNASEPLDEFPFSQAIPADQYPLSISNTMPHASPQGKNVKAEWDQALDQYDIYNVWHKRVEAAVNIQDNTVDGCRTISADTLPIWIEECGEAVQPGFSISQKEETIRSIDSVEFRLNQTGSGEQTTCDPKMRTNYTEYTVYGDCSIGVPGFVEDDWTLQPVLTAIGQDSEGCPNGLKGVIPIPALCGDETTWELVCDDCDEQGGAETLD